MNHPVDRYSAPYDFRVVRRLDDRELARFVADREHDPVDMTFIEAEWQRRQRRAGRAEGAGLAAVALVVSAAALAISGYAAFVRPAGPPPVAAVSAAASAPPLAYNIDEPPFPQRGTAK
jgi:hypothetical protein